MSILLTLFLTSAALVALLSANLWVVRVHKALETLAVVILAPIVLAAILLDRVVGRANPFIWFPRNEREIMAEPPRFFALLKASKSSRLPTDAQLLSISRRPGIESEPGKANLGTSFILRVAYSAGGKQAELDLFIKASSERRIPAWIKAVLAITTTGSPEIDLFLALESGKLSLSTPVPRMLFGAASRLFHRSLLVLEFTPSTKMVNIPDWKAINASYAASVIDLLVPMHARHWRRSGASVIAFADRGPGLNFFTFLDMFMVGGAVPAWVKDLWSALKTHYAKEAIVTLSHGDCRPGNLLFPTGGIKDVSASLSTPPAQLMMDGKDTVEPKVLFTDWEVVSILPAMWDFMYLTVLGMTIEERRKSVPALLARYRQSLIAAGVPPADVTLEWCQLQYAALSFVLLVYGWGLTKISGIGEVHGNSKEDMTAWMSRMTEAVPDQEHLEERLHTEIGIPRHCLKELWSRKPWTW